MRLRMVVPPDVDRPTGGNVYDREVAAALGLLGDEVVLVRAAESDLAAALAEPWPGATLVDGLLAGRSPAAIERSNEVEQNPVAVLVHMPATADIELERRALLAASTVVATSEWSAALLRSRHELANVAVARPGVEAAQIEPGSSPPLLVQVAAVLPHKHQLGVVAALGSVADLPWQARLAGSLHRDPVYASAVMAAVHDVGLVDRVELPGELVRAKAWAGADLCLLPSLVESYGMVVTEALARGVPAVVTAGGPAEALGVTPGGVVPGAVVAPGDVEALAETLRNWLTCPKVRAEWRNAALERRSTLEGWNTTARKLREALG